MGDGGTASPEAHVAWIRFYVANERRGAAESTLAIVMAEWDEAIIAASEHWDIDEIANLLDKKKAAAYGAVSNAKHRAWGRSAGVKDD